MQTEDIQQQVEAIFARHDLTNALRGDLSVTTPLTGGKIGAVTSDSPAVIEAMISKATTAWQQWTLDRDTRVEFLRLLGRSINAHTADLAKLVHYESGKSIRESAADVASTVALIENTLKAASYEPLPSGAERSKEYTSLGVVVIIEPFNFFSIKLWTGVPALLAGNTVICKASENVSLPTILLAEIVRRATREFNADRTVDLVPENVFQVAVGGPDVGKALVAAEGVAKVVVTGSIPVCERVKEADRQLAREARALTEGGAANFVIVSERHDGMERGAYLDFVVGAVLKSVLPYAGQKCIGARLLVVHAEVQDAFAQKMRERLESYGKDWNVESAFAEENPFEFTPLINARAGERFQWALQQTTAQGGELVGGERLGSDRYPDAQYYRPAFGIFPAPVPLLEEEIFGPYFAVVPYSGGVEDALRLAQKSNAKLVNAYYGSDPVEAKTFQRKNEAGFTLVNTPLGTGLLPPYGLGFGGNGLSGQGESFARDPESIFVKQDGAIKRRVTFKLPTS